MKKALPVVFVFVVISLFFLLSSCVAPLQTSLRIDSDNDGVPDNYDYRNDYASPPYYDKCPTSTPQGVKVDDWGCPPDSDKDGVPDYSDRCPDTTKGVIVDNDGCPLDSDKDGVPDYLDKCKDTPTGITVDMNGCPVAEKPVVAPAERSLRVALLPDRDGGVGAVIVKSAQGEVLLNQSYMAADVFTDKKIESKVLDAETVQKQFGQALSAQPQRPVSFTVFFTEGKDELTPESRQMMNQIKAELERRSFPQITVIGHTDRAGSNTINDPLSLKRAEAVRRMLVESGVAASGIETAGRGSRELLVPTGEGVVEPRNRRVEINVR
jgi:outer membrane protein OmpA-like peptidoglycan-associated protein